MKMLIEKNILLEGLNFVSRALSARNIIPVLNGIKFDLKKEGLYLTATDNDITIQYFIEKKDINSIDETGCIIIYGKSLLEIIRKLPETTIMIENFESNEVSFKTETSIYNFNCFLQEDFPDINLEEVKKPIKLSSLKFKEIVSQTSFACSIQESRPLLTGVDFKIHNKKFECVATDSYRLSKVTIELDKSYDENINIVIPAKNINEFIKTIEKDNELEIHTFANKAIFKHGNLIFQTSLLNGTYPNTDNSFPKEYKYELELNLKDFYNILDRASLITQSKDKNIIDLDLNGNTIVIKASSQEMGKVEEKMNIINKYGNNIKISFSAKYMIEALKIFKEEKIYLLLNGEISPIIVKEQNNDELIQLILPMKTY